MADAEKPDLNSVLTHVSTLESEKKQLQEYLLQGAETLRKVTGKLMKSSSSYIVSNHRV